MEKNYDCDKTTKLYLFLNNLTEIKGLDPLTHLRELSLSCNQIIKIEGLDTLKHLQILYLHNNQITEIKGLETLTKLKKLFLYYNKVTELKGLDTLTQLQELDLAHNQITEMKGMEILTQLQILNLSNNQITEMKGLETLTQLQTLFLSNNQITKIKGLETLMQLQKLYLNGNQITEIKGLETLIQLHMLNLSKNRITEIKGLKTLVQLQELSLYQNRIEEIPATIMMCRRLNNFWHDSNVRVDPIIQRFLNRNNVKSNTIKVYNDQQNVHDSAIGKSIAESIYNVIQEIKLDNGDNILIEIVNDSILNELTKKSLIEYSEIDSVHSTFNITFKELLTAVWNVIKNHKNSNDIKEVLNSEMQDSLCKCFTGRLSRLINCLNGFDPRVQVKISESDSIANIIILIRNKYENDVEKQRQEVTIEMSKRGYDKQIINEWLSYME